MRSSCTLCIPGPAHLALPLPSERQCRSPYTAHISALILHVHACFPAPGAPESCMAYHVATAYCSLHAIIVGLTVLGPCQFAPETILWSLSGVQAYFHMPTRRPLESALTVSLQSETWDRS